MKNYQLALLTLLFLCFCTISFAQQGVVSGVLEDEDGPLPGVSVRVKGTPRGTDTDFDGKYSILCKVGDILVFEYLGFETREVQVTEQMFGIASINNTQMKPVTLIRSNAYEKAVQSLKKELYKAPNLSESTYRYNFKKKDGVEEIKRIKIDSNQVSLLYFGQNIYYEIGFDSSFGSQFIKDSNVPELQNTFSQGQSLAGEFVHFGPETGIPFSYGPSLNSLEYDGSNYVFDRNGRLVSLGSGNGIPANAYDNSIFSAALKTSNHAFFKVFKGNKQVQLDLVQRTVKDIFNRELNTHHKVSLNYYQNRLYPNPGWNGFVNYESKTDNQPNLNGFQNNLLLNVWATPPSFENAQGAILADNSQRRFATQFNNPDALLAFNRNRIQENNLVMAIQNETHLNEDFRLDSNLNFSHKNQVQQFGVFSGTAGFEDGFLSDKKIVKTDLNATTTLLYDINIDDGYSDLNVKSKINYKYDHLDFSFVQRSNLDPFSFNNPQNQLENLQASSRNRLSLYNKIEYDFKQKVLFNFVNNSYISSLQNNKWFLPTVGVEVDFYQLTNIEGFYEISLNTNLSYDVNDLPLYYQNLSHNSLLLSPEESLQYTSNNDLFLNPSIALEERRNFEVNTTVSFPINVGSLSFELSYYNTKSSGSVFPIINNNAFELSNVADIRNTGFESTIILEAHDDYEFEIQSLLTFSTFNNKVLRLLGTEERIPIAGFSTVSQNLIEGQPAGILVGSAYARDAQNNILIGNDGFPLVSPTPQIIGNPIPDFKISFTQKVQWRQLKFEMVLDGQHGGQIWNGTQNVLNYLGTSQQSAIERGTTNFVFSGVNPQGGPNTTPVDFYNPNNPISENRFVRYGFAGVAEEAIENASYFNVKSLKISYDFQWDTDYDFFREVTVGLYGYNLFTWSRFRGRNPLSSLYGNISGQELNFFNTPLVSEVGFTLNLKF